MGFDKGVGHPGEKRKADDSVEHTERDLVESLDFDGQLGPEGELVHLLYTTQIRKHRSGEDVEEPIAALETDWKLAFNPDLNAARAESYYAQCQFQKALDVTSRWACAEGVR